MADILEKSILFLKRQAEVFGSYQLSEAKNAQTLWEMETENKSSTSETNEFPQEESPVSPPNLDSVTSLEHLRSLCESAIELRTDLENTNLVFGVGNPNADIMVIGEAPGEQEDKMGEPFVGPAGQLLDKILGAIKLSRNEIYIANILKHRPPNNRDPLPEERLRSLPYLLKQIELVNPKLILCLGKVASSTMLDLPIDTTLSSMRGRFHSFGSRELLVTYHPSALLRNESYKRPTWDDVKMLRARYDEILK